LGEQLKGQQEGNSAKSLRGAVHDIKTTFWLGCNKDSWIVFEYCTQERNSDSWRGV
jgi:hypothetical protein